MKAIDIGQIQARRARLMQEITQHREEISNHQRGIANHEQAITLLEVKLADLDVAERVFAELEGETTDAKDAPSRAPPIAGSPSPELLEAATESEAVPSWSARGRFADL